MLDTYNETPKLWWAHSSDGPNPSKHLDCTHWCVPGVPDLWVRRLAGALLGRAAAV